MERTGGEPDVVGNAIVFMDCAKENPNERRHLCYDKDALAARKKNPPVIMCFRWPCKWV